MTGLDLANLAIDHIGQPSIKYTTPELGLGNPGFDCSGFVVYLLKRLAFPIPEDMRHCNELFDRFGVPIHREALSPGDLVFFSRRGIKPTHVGVMISHHSYVHSPGITGGLIQKSIIKERPISTTSSNPQIYFANPIGFKRPAIVDGRYRQMIR